MERGKRKRMSKAPPAAVKKQDKLFCAATWEAFDWVCICPAAEAAAASSLNMGSFL